MKCSSCGSDNQGQARYCHRCGLPLAATVAPLPASTVLQGRYRINRLLGQGGMGAVYLAEHLALGDWVAVKEMREDLLDPGERAQAVAQFQAEARILARLRHPNLPRVLDHFAERGRWYLVLDYVEGQNLAQIQAAAGGGPLPDAQVLDWAAQLCDVLTYLHGQNAPLIFRDLKPANIMIDHRGRVKLIDFGIVRFFRPDKGTDTLKMGSVGYAPPEQYAGQGQTTPRSDVYALGVTLHELLTGSDPTATPFTFTPPRTLNPKLSQRLSAAVMKALSLDPAGRFASAAEMKQALLAASNGKRRLFAGWAARRKLVAAALALVPALAILGLGTVVALGIFSGGATPTATRVVIVPSSTFTALPPSSTAAVTEALTVLPVAPTSTAIGPSPVSSATPAPTMRIPGVIGRPFQTETAAAATAYPTPRPTTPTPSPISWAPPAPELESPPEGDVLSSAWWFEWEYGELAADQAFDLLIVSEEEKEQDVRSLWAGVITPTRNRSVYVDLPGVATVVNHGEGTYYWTVIVVQVEPYKRIGHWGELREFVFQFPPPTNTPTATPITPTPTVTKPPPP